jgi:hypothetical protein
MKQHVAGHVMSGKICKEIPKNETPAELKARLMIEKAEAKENRKQMDIEIKAANLVLARVGPAVVALDAMLARPGMAMVSSIVKDPLVVSAELFQRYKDTAEAVVTTDGETKLTDVPEIQEVSKQVAQCRKQLALATQMLATLAKVR